MRKSKDKLYYVSNHSCFLLQYHLVMVTKYRHPVISGNLKKHLHNIIDDYFKLQGYPLLEMNSDKDHIHILFEAPPSICLSVFTNNLKTVTSRLIRKEFKDELKTYYWKPYFWSQSYFICTVSERSLSAVQHYIQHQGKNEANPTTKA